MRTLQLLLFSFVLLIAGCSKNESAPVSITDFDHIEIFSFSDSGSVYGRTVNFGQLCQSGEMQAVIVSQKNRFNSVIAIFRQLQHFDGKIRRINNDARTVVFFRCQNIRVRKTVFIKKRVEIHSTEPPSKNASS